MGLKRFSRRISKRMSIAHKKLDEPEIDSSLTLNERLMLEFNKRKLGINDQKAINEFCSLNNVSVVVYDSNGKMCKLHLRGES